MRLRVLVPSLLVVLAASAAPALAEVQTHGEEQFPGKNELSVHLGYQAGFQGSIGNPSGFKLFGEFAHAFTDVVWLDVQLNQTFGFGYSSSCFDRFGRPVPCGTTYYYGGWATEIAVGIKLKFKTGIPLVLEVPIDGAVELLYNRDCSDGGVAVPVFRPGFNVHYFLTRNIGLGAGVAVALGPGFHGSGPCSGSYTDLYGAFDGFIGAEFIL